MRSRNPRNENRRFIDGFLFLESLKSRLGPNVALHLFRRKINEENVLAEEFASVFDHHFIGPDIGLAKVRHEIVLGLFVPTHRFLKISLGFLGKLFFECMTTKGVCNFHLVFDIFEEIIVAIRYVT